MIYLTLLALVLWGCLFIIIDWKLGQPQSVQKEAAGFVPAVTFIICARNEENKITACLNSVVNQRWLTKPKIVVVDDHSTDRTASKVMQFAAKFPNLQIELLKLEKETGKKAGLKLGLSYTSDAYYYFIDADVEIEETALSVMSEKFKDPRIEVALGPVLYRGSGLLYRLLQAENLNNQAVTEAFVKLKRPIMANGANMLICDSIKQRYADSLEENIASGDDVFFIQSIDPERVASCHNLEAAAITDIPTRLSEFWNQRLRWANKSRHYKNPTAKSLAFIVWFCSGVFSLAFFALLMDGLFFWMVGLLGVKWLIEFNTHRRWFAKYGVNHLLVDSIILSVVYPLYVVVIGLAGILGFGFRWKGRKFKS